MYMYMYNVHAHVAIHAIVVARKDLLYMYTHHSSIFIPCGPYRGGQANTLHARKIFKA